MNVSHWKVIQRENKPLSLQQAWDLYLLISDEETATACFQRKEVNTTEGMISSAVLYSHWSLFCFHYRIKSNTRGTYFLKCCSNQQKAFGIFTWAMLQYIKQLYRVLLLPFSSCENTEENVAHVCSARLCSCSYMKMSGLWKTLPVSKLTDYWMQSLVWYKNLKGSNESLKILCR